ncbi:MAG TPA: phosphate ABC transporter substrate-binding protein PstS [Thermoplasmata archaeon]
MSTPDEQLMQKPTGSRTGTYAAVAIVVVVVLLIVVGWQAGWFSPKSSPTPQVVPPGACTPPTPVAISGAGSSFVYPLMFTWAAAYQHSTVGYGSVGSGTGISYLNLTTVDFAASDAPLSPSQQAQSGLHRGVITIPETAGAVSIIYNLPGLAAKVNFSGPILADIYLGSITTWDDPQLQAANPGVTLPSQPITVVERLDGSGTTFAFTDFLSKSSAAWANGPGKATTVTWPTGVQQKGSGGVSGFVQGTPYTVGYVDLSYALTNGIAYGAVKNPSGANILPTIANSLSAVVDGAANLPAGNVESDWYNVSLIDQAGAGDYPITTFSYLMVYASLDGAYGSGVDLNKAENLVNFLNWTLTYGQADSGQLYYVPLPANVVAASHASLQLITYGGAPVPICTQA